MADTPSVPAENPQEVKNAIPPRDSIMGDIFGGTAAMLVAMPSAIAFGLIIYAPLGSGFAGKAAISGILGTVAVALMASLFGGTKKLISAPCAPAAAVLSVLVAELFKSGAVKPELIPVYISLVALFAGLLQLLIGKAGGGRFIKYIPYPVVAGYLSGVGLLIFFGQLPKFLGFSKSLHHWYEIWEFEQWHWQSVIVGICSMMIMLFAGKFIKKVPAAIIALLGGIGAYFLLSFFDSSLLSLEKNTFVIGAIQATTSDIIASISGQWQAALSLDVSVIGMIIFPTLTLTVLLSIDTLKTCVVLDALTFSRHDSNKELRGQGLGNVCTALIGGIPGAGTMGATLVNLNSGAKTQISGVVVGLSALLVLILLSGLVAWIPVSALAGILMIVALRMIDKHIVSLAKHKTTRFDFFCILSVIITALAFSLITAALVGVAFAIMLFLREQLRSSVIRRKVFGNQTSSKKIRVEKEHAVLQEYGKNNIYLELQGQLFFGTTDQLLTELDPYLKYCKYILLDMKKVQSIDFTAVNLFKQIQARAKKMNGFLVFASVPQSLPTGKNVITYLDDLGLTEKDNLKFFEDRDTALEYIEDETLKLSGYTGIEPGKMLHLSEFEFFAGLSSKAHDDLRALMEEKTIAKDQLIFHAGEDSDEIYFIRRGNVKIVLPLAGGVHHHIVSFGAGNVFGDMSFLDREKRSANAVAEDEVALFVLSREKFDAASKNYPEIAALFFERLAFALTNRLRQSNIELKALQEN